MANLGYLQLTRSCVQSCMFCSNPPTKIELTEDQMRVEIDRLVELDYDGIILTGGEPACSSLLLPALEYSSARGLHCRMITNGRLLADEAFFKGLVDAGLVHIHVSIHSARQDVHDFLTRSPGAWRATVKCISLAPQMGITSDVNTVINAYNGDHLDETVIWLCREFPHISHFVWNNLDPIGERTKENPECVPRHRDFQITLERAMVFLHRNAKTFRAERVPLCYMRRFPWASTETRKIIKEEERSIRFLDDKGLVRQMEFLHGKGIACDVCRYDPICAGMYAMATTYDERELSPIFDDPQPVIEEVLGDLPSKVLLDRILDRRGRRSPTEQPDDHQRMIARQKPL